MGWGFAIRAIGSGQSWVLRLDMTSRLIGGGLSDHLSSSSKGQGAVLQVMDCSATRIPSLSITGRHPWPTGGSIGGRGILCFCRGGVGVFYCPSRKGSLFLDIEDSLPSFKQAFLILIVSVITQSISNNK